MLEPLDPMRRVYALQHLESGEYICRLQDDVDYLACFSDQDTALEFRTALGLNEHVGISVDKVWNYPFNFFWLDGANAVLPGEDTSLSPMPFGELIRAIDEWAPDLPTDLGPSERIYFLRCQDKPETIINICDTTDHVPHIVCFSDLDGVIGFQDSGPTTDKTFISAGTPAEIYASCAYYNGRFVQVKATIPKAGP